MGTEYADEKFSDAVRALATGRERIKERLVDAVMYVARINVERDVPNELLDVFNDFLHRMTSGAPKVSGEGTIQAMVREMTEDRAVETAQQILSLAREFEMALADERKR